MVFFFYFKWLTPLPSYFGMILEEKCDVNLRCFSSDFFEEVPLFLGFSVVCYVTYAQVYVFWYLSCLLFSEPLGSVVWLSTINFGNSWPLLFQTLLLLLSFFLLLESHDMDVKSLVIVPQFLDILFLSVFFFSWFFSLCTSVCGIFIGVSSSSRSLPLAV